MAKTINVRGGFNNRGRGRNFRQRSYGRGFNNQSSGRWYSNNNQSDQTQRCQLCNGWNHTTHTCPQSYSHTVSPMANITSVSTNPSITWYPDSAASHHVTQNLTGMIIVEPYLGHDELDVGDGKGLNIHNICHSTIKTPTTTF